jgi:hypothetical protein
MENDSNVFLIHFFKKIVALKSVAIDGKNDRTKIVSEITKIIKYCKSDTAVIQMKCFQAFFHYAFGYVNEQFNDDYNLFMIHLKIDCGHCEYIPIKKNAVIFDVPVTKSISFGDCTQRDRTAFFEKSKEIILDKYGIKFDDWFTHYQSNENTI